MNHSKRDFILKMRIFPRNYCLIIFAAFSICAFSAAPSLAVRQDDPCREKGLIIKNLTTRGLWFKRDGGDCYLWDENKIFSIKADEKFEIFSDLVCETLYCENVRHYRDYRSFDTDGDCAIRVLPGCRLSDM